jgi:hypothetical protein
MLRLDRGNSLFHFLNFKYMSAASMAVALARISVLSDFTDQLAR